MTDREICESIVRHVSCNHIPCDECPLDRKDSWDCSILSCEPDTAKKWLEDHPVEEDEMVAGGSTPQQYGLPEEAIELQDLIEYRGMNFALGNIFKACYRQGHCEHSDALRDMRKVKWFAEREIKRLES